MGVYEELTEVQEKAPNARAHKDTDKEQSEDWTGYKIERKKWGARRKHGVRWVKPKRKKHWADAICVVPYRYCNSLWDIIRSSNFIRVAIVARSWTHSNKLYSIPMQIVPRICNFDWSQVLLFCIRFTLASSKAGWNCWVCLHVRNISSLLFVPSMTFLGFPLSDCAS